MNFTKILLSTLCLPLTAFATPFNWQNLELSIAAGPSWYQASNGYTQSFPNETDTNQVTNVGRTPLYRFGVGYHFFTEQLHDRKYFNDLLVEINLYHDNAVVRGDYYQFGSSNADNFTYRAPMSSTRLMLDLKPTLFTWHQFSPYAVLGAGVSWNRMSLYTTSTTSGYEAYQTTLPAETNRNATYEAGLGVNAAISKHLSASLEYLSTHLGRVSPGTNDSVISSPNFPITSQSVLVGLSWKF